MSVIVLFVVLFLLLLIGVPVGFAIGGATLVSMATTTNLDLVINAQYCYSGIFSFTVMAIPLAALLELWVALLWLPACFSEPFPALVWQQLQLLAVCLFLK